MLRLGNRLGRATFPVVVLLVALAHGSPAQARCQDSPKPRVDWTGCSKPQLMLSKDDLTGAVFTKAALTGTEFVGAKLAGAKLEDAEISHARFDGADLSRTAGLKQAQLDLACGTKTTKLPPGLTAPKGWPCVEEDD